jgi:protoporphyrinogen oxidase
VLRRLLREIESLGGQIRTATPIERISGDRAGATLMIAGCDDAYDHVITTIPSRLLIDTAPGLSSAYAQKLMAVKYLGIVCFVLVLKRKLSPFYVTNLCDEDIPFTGIIEMTNLISMEETAGNHLVYLPKYTAPDNPLFGASESDLWDLFRAGLMRVVPTLEDSDIKRRFLFRERFVQPVPVLHYSDLVPPMETDVPGVLLANTTQIVNSTLNNNAMVQIARQSVTLLTGSVRETAPGAGAVTALKPSLESNS